MRKGSYSEELVRNELVEHVVVLGDHVGIFALLKAMTRQGKRQYVRGVSVMRTEIVFRRKANSNIAVELSSVNR